MPALTKSKFTAKVTFLGVNPDREAGLQSTSQTSVSVGFEGFAGDSHFGLNRASCARVLDLYKPGTEIRNTRQISILSAEELAEVASAMQLAALNPCLVGASLVLEGIPDFSHVPPGSRLQAANGTTLTLDIENRPCNFPGLVIEKAHPGKGKAFKVASKNLRGVTAWVERPGSFQVGDVLELFVPTQPTWQP